MLISVNCFNKYCVSFIIPVALESWFQSYCFASNSILDRMADVQVQRWIDKVEAVFDSQSEVAPLSGGDTKTILTPGVSINSNCS